MYEGLAEQHHCPDCGAFIASNAVEHVCNVDRLVTRAMADLDSEWSQWTATAKGAFEVFYAAKTRLRDHRRLHWRMR